MLVDDKVVLNSGEILRKKSERSKGHMGQIEITTYDVIDESGDVVGSVEHTDNFQINGLRSRNHLVQKNIVGKIIVDIHW